MNRALFDLGVVVATPGAMLAMAESAQLPDEFLTRHVAGDWGDVCAEDRQANEYALRQGTRLFSVYHTDRGERLWLITEADRSSSCILLPSEY